MKRHDEHCSRFNAKLKKYYFFSQKLNAIIILEKLKRRGLSMGLIGAMRFPCILNDILSVLL